MRLIDADVLMARTEERHCRPCKRNVRDCSGTMCSFCVVRDYLKDIQASPTVELDIEKRVDRIEKKLDAMNEDGWNQK